MSLLPARVQFLFNRRTVHLLSDEHKLYLLLAVAPAPEFAHHHLFARLLKDVAALIAVCKPHDALCANDRLVYGVDERIEFFAVERFVRGVHEGADAVFFSLAFSAVRFLHCLNPAGRIVRFLKVERVRVKDVLEVNHAVICFYNARLSLKVPNCGAYGVKLLLRNGINFIDDNGGAEFNLLDQEALYVVGIGLFLCGNGALLFCDELFSATEFACKTCSVHHGDDVVKLSSLNRRNALGDWRRFADAACLDERGVDVHLANVVYNHRSLDSLAVIKNMIEQCGFARTEIPCEKGYGNGTIHHANAFLIYIFVHGSTSVPHVNLYSQVHSSTAHPVETSVNATSNGAEPVAGSGKNVNAATGGTSDVVTTIKSSFVTVSLP